MTTRMTNAKETSQKQEKNSSQRREFDLENGKRS